LRGQRHLHALGVAPEAAGIGKRIDDRIDDDRRRGADVPSSPMPFAPSAFVRHGTDVSNCVLKSRNESTRSSA